MRSTTGCADHASPGTSQFSNSASCAPDHGTDCLLGDEPVLISHFLCGSVSPGPPKNSSAGLTPWEGGESSRATSYAVVSREWHGNQLVGRGRPSWPNASTD